MQIISLPAFRDNYIWLLRAGSRAAVVDPGDAAPVLRYLAEEGLQLSAILLTHHHADHVCGVAALLQHRTVPVFGPASEAIAGITNPVRQGDVLALPDFDANFTVLDIPGHTAGHVGYYSAPVLFCGDTLFAAGCGRVFDGTMAQLFASLEKLSALPDETRVYCTHEYTLANLAFAAAVEPGNPAIVERIAAATASRERGEATVPFFLGGERRTNPFLRCREPDVISAAEAQAASHPSSPEAVFTALREWKNRF